MKRFMVRVVVTGLVLFIIWLQLLIMFVERLPSAPEDTNTVTDAIVSLTGGSGRLNVAVLLLAEGKAKRLFISGVGEKANVASMLILSGKLPDNIAMVTDHIDLGYKATDTIENASETAEWMHHHHFTSLRLVTANYHMPRSLLEFKRAMPDIQIIPHPMVPDDVVMREWWQHRSTKRLLISEFHKYIAALLRSWMGL